ncbi:hypothetical protein BDV98DRAFT_607005 [Pterulicium gracile]|uniref:Uncharacterized protein n=1 Tax=Pterulicium gracile TaxID=1884261 RepID=A0A5C3Q893_9AGAR|nr:hypothetical protein BDV98DRAFT_607005 [Pterula gracilis]
MDHFRPHLFPRPSFEGYYTHLTLPSSASLILIISSVFVPSVQKKHMVSITYVPPSFPDAPCFKRELFVDDIQMTPYDPLEHGKRVEEEGKDGAAVAFKLTVSGVGYMTVWEDDSVEIDVSAPSGEWEFAASVPGGVGKNRAEWIRGERDSTPEGVLVNLPLPLHWHVHSLASECTFELSISEKVYAHLHALDASPSTTTTTLKTTNGTAEPKGVAMIHLEKNWAHSFPSSHIWLRAHNPPSLNSHDPSSGSSLCLAGGRTLGVDAYLITYHAPSGTQHDVSFVPPWSMSLPVPFLSSQSLSPTHSAVLSYPTRTIHLRTSTLTHRISITASAPPDTFIPYSAPFYDGHRPNFLAQSYYAHVEVRVERRALVKLEGILGMVLWLLVGWMGGGWGERVLGFLGMSGLFVPTPSPNERGTGSTFGIRLGPWEEISRETFKGASLEFGGDVYGDERKGRADPQEGKKVR